MSTVNLEQGNNYHILKDGAHYCVEYTKDGKVFRKNILPSYVTRPIVVDYCDERVLLADGNFIRRKRNNIQ